MAADAHLTERQINILEMRYRLERIRIENQEKTAGYEARITEHCQTFQQIVKLDPNCIHYNLTLYGRFHFKGITFKVETDEDYSQTTLLIFALEQDAPLQIFQTLLNAKAEIAPLAVRSILNPQLPRSIKIEDPNAFIALMIAKKRSDIFGELINRQLLTEAQKEFILSNKVTAFLDSQPPESASSNDRKSKGPTVLSSLSNFFQTVSDRVQYGNPSVMKSGDTTPSVERKNQ